MDKIYEQTLLYDFYGELLTEHQRSIYEDAVYNDMSLGEIAEDRGISRQGVHDLIRRCDRILQDYEAKLHLVERFVGAKEKIAEIMELTQTGQGADVCGSAQGDTDVPEGAGCGAGRDNAGVLCRMERIRELLGQLLQEL